MAKKIYYEKVGRKYVPVSEYDSDFVESLPKGNHLVMCYPGGKSRRFNIDPNYAAMIAAGRVAEDVISTVIVKATDLQLGREERKKPLTPSQKAAWDNLVKEFGESASRLEWPSAREATEEAVKAMMKEAEKMMQNEAVKKAFDHFQLVCQLVKQESKNES